MEPFTLLMMLLPFYLLCLIWAKRCLGIWINHYSIFTVISVGSLLIYFIDPPIKVHDETLFVFIWGLFFYNITIFFFSKIRFNECPGKNWIRISISYKLVIVTFVLLLPFLITLRHQFSAGLELWQIRAERSDVMTASQGMIYLYAIAPLSMIIIVLSYYKYYIPYRNNSKFIFFSAIIIIFSLSLVEGGGRTGLMNWFFVYLLAAYLNKTKWSVVLNDNAKLKWYFVAIPMSIIVIITALRGISSEDNTFMDAIRNSYTMHILLFDWYYSSNWFDTHTHTLGLSTFESPVLFLNMILSLFTGERLTYETVDSIIQEFRYIGGEYIFNACTSMYFRFVRDWGNFGVVIGPMIVSIYLSLLYKFSIRNKFCFLIYLYSLAMVCHLHNELAFSKVAYLLFIIYMIVLKILYCRRKKIAVGVRS